MKIIFTLFLFMLMSLPAFAMKVDPIHEDTFEKTEHAFHTRGLMSYGLHSNTFHVRYFLMKYQYTIKDLMLFAGLKGYIDTHVPETNYAFILQNVQIYDYGFYYKILDLAFISIRGAAVYPMNEDTFLLFPSYTYIDNPAEFDSPAQYIPRFRNAAGIRAGFAFQDWTIGYSQGDYRHSIPSAGLVQWKTDNGYVRLTGLFEHSDPLNYIADSFNFYMQLSGRWDWSIVQDWTLKGIAEVTWYNGGTLWFRTEEALSYQEYTLSFRQLVVNNMPAIFEFSLGKSFYDVLSLGFFAATDGRFYIASSVNF